MNEPFDPERPYNGQPFVCREVDPVTKEVLSETPMDEGAFALHLDQAHGWTTGPDGKPVWNPPVFDETDPRELGR